MTNPKNSYVQCLVRLQRGIVVAWMLVVTPLFPSTTLGQLSTEPKPSHLQFALYSYNV